MLSLRKVDASFPASVQARCLWLKVSTDMPRTVYEFMDLYPQGTGLRLDLPLEQPRAERERSLGV